SRGRVGLLRLAVLRVVPVNPTRDQRGRGFGTTLELVADQRLTIDARSESLSHAAVLERSALHVEVDPEGRELGDLDDVGRYRVGRIDHQVQLAGAVPGHGRGTGTEADDDRG